MCETVRRWRRIWVFGVGGLEWGIVEMFVVFSFDCFVDWGIKFYDFDWISYYVEEIFHVNKFYRESDINNKIFKTSWRVISRLKIIYSYTCIKCRWSSNINLQLYLQNVIQHLDTNQQ